MEELDDILDHNIKGTPNTDRPAFITVLCILTWVGAGLGFLAGLYSLFTLGFAQRTYENLGIFSDNIDIDRMMRWQRLSVYANLFGNALCLTGAFFMWNLRKLGYFIYVPGQIIPLVVGVFTALSFTSMPLFGNWGILGIAIGAIFPIAFLIMYGLNLKHMR